MKKKKKTSVPTSDFASRDLEWSLETQLTAHIILTPGVWIVYFVKRCANLTDQWDY